MKPNQEFAKRHAEQLLVLARETANSRGELILTAERVYGDHGSLISGIHRNHFPEEVKNILRDMALQFGSMVDRSFYLWTRMARMRKTTWLRKKEQLGVFHY